MRCSQRREKESLSKEPLAQRVRSHGARKAIPVMKGLRRTNVEEAISQSFFFLKPKRRLNRGFSAMPNIKGNMILPSPTPVADSLLTRALLIVSSQGTHHNRSTHPSYSCFLGGEENPTAKTVSFVPHGTMKTVHIVRVWIGYVLTCRKEVWIRHHPWGLSYCTTCYPSTQPPCNTAIVTPGCLLNSFAWDLRSS